MERSTSRTRRTVLRLAAASAGTALLAGCGGPGDENETEDDGPEFEEGTGNGQEREDDEEHAAENESTEEGADDEGGDPGDGNETEDE